MFYDLPGCINVYDMPKSVLSDLKQQQDEERDLIDMITSTVTSYIRDEKCLLLLACSADQDVEMSLTMKYIRQHSAEDRCIGVFAKADLVASTRLKNVQDILSGDKYELGKGWFVTKQLSQQEIDDGVDFDSGRVREKDLFATAPWTECLSLHDRYGMFNLQDEIASSLASHIFSELPNMTERIADRIATVKAELDQFPDPPKEPNHVVMKLIEQFARCLSSHIDAGSDDNPFRMQFDDLLLAFSKQLQASKLEVGMNNSKGSNEKDVGVTQVRNTKKVSTQTKKRAGDATSCKRVKPSPFVASTGRVVYKLDDLRMRYNRGATNSIPGSINDKVTEQLIRDSCIEWKDIVAKLLKDVSSLVRRMISDSKEEALSEWTYTELSKEIQQKTLAYFNKTIATEGEGINQHLSRMYAYPGTLNNDFETFNRSHLRSLLDQRYPKESDKLAKARSKIPNPYDVPLEQYSKEARDANSQWTNERLADDQFGSRLQCVATIHTHHDILSSNLADTASMQLKYDVLAKLRDEAAGMLRAELNVLDTVRCAALLAEDPAREKRRKLLLTEEAKLEKAMRIIDDLQGTE